jgi:hypothetical protein
VSSTHDNSTFFQPRAGVMSMTVRVSVPAMFARSASTSNTAPLADCTRLAVTTS